MAFSVCWLTDGRESGDTRIVETRLGLEQAGHLTNLSPSESFLPSSLNCMWRDLDALDALDGETRMEAEWFLSLLVLGEIRLKMSTIALLGEILRSKNKFSLPRFSLSLFISDM